MDDRGDVAATALASIALVIAILAGVVAWMAYDRTGVNLDKRIQDQVNQSAQGLKSSLQGSTTTPSGGTGGSSQGAATPSGNTGASANTSTDTVPQTQP